MMAAVALSGLGGLGGVVPGADAARLHAFAPLGLATDSRSHRPGSFAVFQKTTPTRLFKGLLALHLPAQFSEPFLGVQLEEEPKPSFHHGALGPEARGGLCRLEKVRLDLNARPWDALDSQLSRCSRT